MLLRSPSPLILLALTACTSAAAPHRTPPPPDEVDAEETVTPPRDGGPRPRDAAAAVDSRTVVPPDAGEVDLPPPAVDVERPPPADDAGPPPAPGACDDDPGPRTGAPAPAWGDPLPACTRTVPVATSAELQAKLSAAQAGDCLVLADGHYSVGTVTAKGRAAAPVVVRAANRLKAVIDSGTLSIKSSAYLVFEGFDWTSSGAIDVSSCDHCRFTRNHFHLTETGNLDWIVLRGSQWARIDHNELGPKPHPGNAISVFGTSTVAQHTRIDHNYLHDFAGGTFPAGGCDKNPGGEAMRLGVSTYEAQSAFTIVEHNLFERCNGDPETISSKSSDNVIRYNTLRGSAGSISLRAGNRGRVCGNYVIGAGQICAGGVRLCGDDHQVFDNYVEGVSEPAMQLHPGDKDHAAVRRALVVGNTFLGINQALQVGSDAASATIANNLLEGTSGGVVSAVAVPPGLTVNANLAHLLGRATLGVKGAPWEAGITAGDPRLVKKGEVFVLGAGSSAIDKGAPFSFLTTDIEGQARDARPDIGADELSTAPALRGPLTPADVGLAAP